MNIRRLTIRLWNFFTLIKPQVVVKFCFSPLFRLGAFRYVVVFDILIVLGGKKNIQIYSNFRRRRRGHLHHAALPLIFWTFWRSTNNSKASLRAS